MASFRANNNNCSYWIVTLLLPFLVALARFGRSESPYQQPPSVPALIIFGDSTVDPGNNNNRVLTLIKSDFPPYGRDFYGHTPTGRFCNGKIVTDYIVDSLRLKELLPAYLDPNLSGDDLLTGVSFASAGSGYDNATAMILSAIPLWRQLQYFRVYIKQVRAVAGGKRAERILSHAIYGISMGSNDFVNNYFVNPIRQAQFSLSEYQDFLVGIARSFLLEIHRMGAGRIAVIGLPPLGCLPSVITLRAGGHRQDCIEDYNKAAVGFNQKLVAMVESLQNVLVGTKMIYGDIFGVFTEMVRFPNKYGFQETREGCCGTGLLEVAVLCNPKATYTCTNASQYVFWDSFHPTQKAYEILAQHIIQNDLPRLL